MSQALTALRKTVGNIVEKTERNSTGKTEGNIVGNIEGYAGPTLAGKYFAGSLLATLRHLKTVCQRWHASSDSRYKLLAVLAPCQHPASGLPALATPKLKGVDSDMESTVQGCWYFAGSAGQLASGRLAFIFPEGKEGVNTVDNPVLAIWVGIKDLGVAINPGRSATTLSDFARNIVG